MRYTVELPDHSTMDFPNGEQARAVQLAVACKTWVHDEWTGEHINFHVWEEEAQALEEAQEDDYSWWREPDCTGGR